MDFMQRLIDTDAIRRLAAHDVSLYTDDVDVRQSIAQRLCWTDLAEQAQRRIPLIRNLAQTLVEEGATDIVLLGMGGSSLAALTISHIIGSADGMPRLHVLDTTNPVVVDRLLRRLSREHTFVLVSSKSGTTIEPLSLYAIFREWMEQDLARPAAGKHFIVITDPGTQLEALRSRDVMRLTLNAPPGVGGRFSALSLFGLTPAALIGVDVEMLTARARAMEARCRESSDENPAAALAVFMSDAWAARRDKITLVTSPGLEPFGLWVEQLVAESTGKVGTGLIPILDGSPAAPPQYAADRAVVVMRRESDAALADWAANTSENHPVFEIALQDSYDIGAEFVRWEHAVALTGFLLGLNPFDEPNVAEAKQATSRVLAGEISAPAACADLGGTWATYAGGLVGTTPPVDLTSAMAALIESLDEGNYFTVLAYLPNDEALLGSLRTGLERISTHTGCSTSLQVGPRYLHSTGQLHKGGPKTGVFLVLTARDVVDVPIPGGDLTLARLFRAQAEGDLITLAAHGLRVARLDLPRSDASSVAPIGAAMMAASKD